MAFSRYDAEQGTRTAPGWKARQITLPSALFGANGIRFGPDGRLYVAQCYGGRISAIDVMSYDVQTICEMGGTMVAPDDIAFDTSGVMHVTDVMSATVRMVAPNGIIQDEQGNVPCANGITVHQDRVFIDECRHGGRVLELSRGGTAPRVLAENIECPNAMAAGPDGYLYFPLVTENQVWRVPIDGGAAECFVGDLAVPTAVKFSPNGNLVTVQAGSGQILQIDLQSRKRTLLATLRPGLDNLDFDKNGRLYVSHFSDGGISRIQADGSEHSICPAGFVGPYGIAFGDDGALYCCDGLTMAAVGNGECYRVGSRLDGCFPGWVRGVVGAPGGGLIVTTVEGDVAFYHPQKREVVFHARGLDGLFDLAVDRRGAILVCEGGAGRVLKIAGANVTSLAQNLARPTGIAVAVDGTCYVSEARSGRVLSISNSEIDPVLTGLMEPHGLTISNGKLFILDVGARALLSFDMRDKKTETVATNLPVGPQFGTRPHDLPGIPGRIPGPLSPFAGLTAKGGQIFISANGNGSIMAISRE